MHQLLHLLLLLLLLQLSLLALLLSYWLRHCSSVYCCSS
jgi:hypothetical protein